MEEIPGWCRMMADALAIAGAATALWFAWGLLE